MGGLDLFDPSEIPGGRPYEELRPRAVEAVVQGIFADGRTLASTLTRSCKVRG